MMIDCSIATNTGRFDRGKEEEEGAYVGRCDHQEVGLSAHGSIDLYERQTHASQ